MSIPREESSFTNPVHVRYKKEAMEGDPYRLWEIRDLWNNGTLSSSDYEKSFISCACYSHLPEIVRKGGLGGLYMFESLLKDGTIYLSNEEISSIMSDFKASKKRDYDGYLKKMAMDGDKTAMSLINTYCEEKYLYLSDVEISAVRAAHNAAVAKNERSWPMKKLYGLFGWN
jgi:hypothetical protein